MLKGYKTVLPLRIVDVVGVVETVFAMWSTGQRADGLKRGVKCKTNSNTTAHNLAYAVNIRTKREHRMYLVCSVLDLPLPPKHCHTTDIAQVTSLLPRVIPISRHNISNRISPVGFVSKSASCFLPSMCSILMSSSKYLSFTQKCRTSVCFDLLWYSRFLVSLMELALSMYSIGVFPGEVRQQFWQQALQSDKTLEPLHLLQ